MAIGSIFPLKSKNNNLTIQSSIHCLNLAEEPKWMETVPAFQYLISKKCIP